MLHHAGSSSSEHSDSVLEDQTVTSVFAVNTVRVRMHKKSKSLTMHTGYKKFYIL